MSTIMVSIEVWLCDFGCQRKLTSSYSSTPNDIPFGSAAADPIKLALDTLIQGPAPYLSTIDGSGA